MNLIIGLAAVDEVNGGGQMRQLANGWMGWESKSGQRLRVFGARVLVSLAARLDPTQHAPITKGTSLTMGSPAA